MWTLVTEEGKEEHINLLMHSNSLKREQLIKRSRLGTNEDQHDLLTQIYSFINNIYP